MRNSFAFPTLDNLVDLACRDGVDIRPTLVRVLTDLYVQKAVHTPEEEIQYVELALRLIETVDEATRAAIAARLSNYPAAPAVILRKLAETNTLPAAAEPERQTRRELIELFFAATAAERRLILLNLAAIIGPLTRKPVPAAGDLTVRLEAAALQRNVADFRHTLERALGIELGLAQRIADDPSGEPIVVLAKAIGMQSAPLQRVLLLLNPQIGQSVQRVYALASLFDEIDLAAAEQMLAIWRQPAGKASPRHVPVYVDAARANARTLSSPPRRSAPREAPPVRIRSNER